MDPLTTEGAAAILTQAGARRVTLKQKAAGRFREILAYFEHRGTGHVWRVRGDGYVQNFQRDVERELA